MSNPIFGMFGNQQMHPILQRFQQFRQMFRGDPKEQIQQMLNSGKINQQQYNQAVQTAQQLQKMLGIR